jgi:hypothetical protein
MLSSRALFEQPSRAHALTEESMPRIFVSFCLLLIASFHGQSQPAPLRPPSVPLIAHDPYYSVWSASDKLTETNTRHWTGTEQALTGWISVDGKTYRWMGNTPRWVGAVPPLEQVGMSLTPTSTNYAFEGAGVHLDIRFFTPALPQDLAVLSRPVTYLEWSVRSTDGKPHRVKMYLDAAAALALDRPDQQVQWSRHRVGEMEVMRIGTKEQSVLSRSGDNLRIDWGHFYLGIPPGPAEAKLAAGYSRIRPQWVNTLDVVAASDLESADYGTRDTPLLVATVDAGSVGANAVSSYFVLAYDDVYSIEFFQRRLRPYWRTKGFGVEAMLKAAVADYASLRERSAAFDKQLTDDLIQAGGAKYAAVAILAYRQALAAHKLARDIDGTPLYFSKENFSNGCIATVDVTYPGAPIFLLLNPALLQAQLEPVFQYVRTGRWNFPYAPHDLGQYPLANGQVYGGGEDNEDRQMPVEESGNMIILMAALAKAQGNADYARQWWPTLTRWADYLKDKGMDPENQLNTDDFAGHSEHHANLSIKAIVALASYAWLAGELGHSDVARSYRATAEQMAAKWKQMAADGDHYRLAFDQPGSWSQKYNMVWDKLLGLKLFPPDIVSTEIAYYKTKQNKYGLPLDSRSEYTKLDWIYWTATMASSPQDFATLTDPVYTFLNETPDRVPMTDWYWTHTGKQRGFQARSVVGGVFIKMLEDSSRWKRWAQAAKQ